MQDRLKRLIAYMGLNQSKFATLVGITRPEINKILNGKRNLTEGMIGRIVARTGVSENWLRNNEGEIFASATTAPTTSPPTPLEFARSHGCSEAIAEIFARYCALPDEKKTVFEEIVDSLVEKKKNRASNAATVSVNNVYGDNNTTIN